MKARNIKAPLFITHGLKDRVIPFEQSEKIANLLFENGKRVTYLNFENEKYHFQSTKSWIEFCAIAEQFLK